MDQNPDIEKTIQHWISTSDKDAFYKKCTFEFTTEWIDKIKLLQTWIKEKL